MRRVWAILAMVMTGGMVSLSAEGATPQYHFADIGTLGGFTSGLFSINSSGTAVGYSYTAARDHSHLIVFSGGVMTDLGLLLGGDTSGNAISNAGQLAGRAETSSGTPHGFVYSAGVTTDLRPLGMDTANAINSAGQAAGMTVNEHPALYSGGVVTDMGVSGEALGINDSAVVVGYYSTGAYDPLSNAIVHGFAYLGGAVTDLGSLGGTQGQIGRAHV